MALKRKSNVARLILILGISLSIIMMIHPTYLQMNIMDTRSSNPTSNITGYPINDMMRIEIMIASYCSAEETKFRFIERDSWIKVLRNYKKWEILNKAFMSKCIITYHYFIGDCLDDENEAIIQNESLRFNDIIRLKGYTEKWDKLQMKTLKMILYSFKNINNEHPFDLLYKLDSDYYLDIARLTEKLIDLFEENKWNSHKHALYIGKLWPFSVIRKNKNDKYENRNWSQHLGGYINHYIQYMGGGAYLLSFKTVQIVYNAIGENDNIKNVAYSKMEDAYLGHLLSAYNVKYVNDECFSIFKENSIALHCDGDPLGIHNEICRNIINKTRLLIH